jgi:hypothetical protein
VAFNIYFYYKMTLLFDGRMYSERVRNDITLGNVVPPIGTTLILISTDNPNTKYTGTQWHNDTAGDIVVNTVAYKKWIRIG